MMPTPIERLEESRRRMSLVVRQEPPSALQGVLRIVQNKTQQYPLATVAVLLVGTVLILRTRPWRWIPWGAGLGMGLRTALAKLAWRTAVRAFERNVQTPSIKDKKNTSA